MNPIKIPYLNRQGYKISRQNDERNPFASRTTLGVLFSLTRQKIRHAFRHILYPVMALFLLSIPCLPAIAGNWLPLKPGIEYQDLNISPLTRWSHIHVFRVNLSQNFFELTSAQASTQPHATVDEFAHHHHALIALNGGFFDEKYRPLGLRISHHQQHNPIKAISWWGIFYIKEGKPHLSSISNYKHNAHIEFAIQTGPRLLIQGQIPALKAGFAERSALGITQQGEVIVVVTENAPMTTTALAELMKSAPLNCTDALNLDGGSSSQLYARIGAFTINAPGFAHVADAIIVKSRTL